ncbi:MAG: anaerobic ribonucleoside-triphosphate reductase activating protein [Coriobacteriales bacterium]|nr:anaerobic ribonucleoside-triphosphate reductase activating protein [Coriobacteriales bacterium]
MNYAEIKECDIANGVGVRTSLFVSGCRHRCPGCFNEVAWDFAAGEPFSTEVADRIIASLSTPYVDGLSVLGGEPLEPENQAVLAPFLERVRAEVPDKDIWLWTGFVWEDLVGGTCRACTSDLDRILACLSVVVDGPFVEAQKDITLRFRGSANQRLIDVAASLEQGAVVPWQDGSFFSKRSW